jgi:hypothetical protein
MRKRLVLLLSLGLLLAADKKDKPPDKDLKSLIDRAFVAAGGEKRLTAIPAATMEVVYRGPNKDNGTTAYFVQKPDRLRVVYAGEKDGKKVTAVTVLNGDQAWYQQNGAPRESPPGAVEELKLVVRYFPAVHLSYLKDRTVRLAPLGEKKTDGREALSLKATLPRGGSELLFFFDKATGQLLKREAHRKDGAVFESAYADYRKTGGIMFPRKLTLKQNGKPVGEREVVSFKVLEKLDPKLFEKPQAAQSK